MQPGLEGLRETKPLGPHGPPALRRDRGNAEADERQLHDDPQLLQIGGTLKHPTERLRPVFDGNRCCGFLMPHIRGFDAYDISGAKVGSYPETHAAEAVARLRRYASERSS
jgi:hypothetical protein